jgi:hypothetical protein
MPKVVTEALEAKYPQATYKMIEEVIKVKDGEEKLEYYEVLHAVTFDGDGNGVYRMQNGKDWVYPAEGFKEGGSVGRMAVQCLSPTTQVLSHAHGYVPVEKDYCDMNLLVERFGVELPPQLRRGL